MNMITIGLIRHGLTDWNEEGRIQGSIDIPLNDKGKWMAKRLANRLRCRQWDTIYTSPLQRAQMTAHIIADDQQSVPIHIDGRLKEIGEGKLEATTEQDRIARWGENWFDIPLGREAIHLVHERARFFLEDLEKSGAKSVLIVSHGSFIEELLVVLGVKPNHATELHNGSLTIVEYGEKQRCISYNCIKHL